ncbi:hypothetical protein L6452_27898 [Arctium lappa]|uniref:Uncharacterized protein n=1 Tax=Arctium lappa TaxID=4217 RepID=A0ACB8ZVZ5_ARCLA|nr:hypothetical protein L6452_27898 [Arctium lappa]
MEGEKDKGVVTEGGARRVTEGKQYSKDNNRREKAKGDVGDGALRRSSKPTYQSWNRWCIPSEETVDGDMSTEEVSTEVKNSTTMNKEAEGMEHRVAVDNS